MVNKISNIFSILLIILSLTFFIIKCENEIPTQTVEEKDQVKDPNKQDYDEKKSEEVYSLMKDFNN